MIVVGTVAAVKVKYSADTALWALAANAENLLPLVTTSYNPTLSPHYAGERRLKDLDRYAAVD